MRTSRLCRTLVAAGLAAVSLGCTSTPGRFDDLGELRLASDVWPPFTDVETNPRVALELVHTALERIGIRATTRMEEDFAGLTAKIRSGELDGSAALWRSPERESYLVYSSPYLENRLVLVGRKGADMTAKTFSDLTGRRVALVGGYAYGEAVENADGPRFIEGRSDADNLKSLLDGRVDYVLADALLVHHLVRSDEEKARRLLQVGAASMVKRSLHFAIRRDLPRAREIVDRFNAEIGRMLADGSYNRILRLAWIRVDVDGDGIPELVLGGKEAGLIPPDLSYDVFDPERTDDREPRYIIEGESYDSWQQVPPRYKSPHEGTGIPERPGEEASREWGVPLLSF